MLRCGPSGKYEDTEDGNAKIRYQLDFAEGGSTDMLTTCDEKAKISVDIFQGSKPRSEGHSDNDVVKGCGSASSTAREALPTRT